MVRCAPVAGSPYTPFLGTVVARASRAPFCGPGVTGIRRPPRWGPVVAGHRSPARGRAAVAPLGLPLVLPPAPQLGRGDHGNLPLSPGASFPPRLTPAPPPPPAL